MAKKRKIEKKMIAKLPETSNLDPDFTIPKDGFTFSTIKDFLKSKYIQITIALTFIGFVLRFYHLGFNSLWLDEASTLTFVNLGSFIDIWKLSTTMEPSPPLFIWLEYITTSLFGSSEVILRLVPALAGACTIPIMYFIGKEFIDENVGIISAALFTISPFLIMYSQEARAYSVLLFFLSLTLLEYLIAIKKQGYTHWILFGIFASLAFWTHFYTAIFLAGILIYTLFIYKIQYIKEISVSIGVMAITVIPLMIMTLPVLLARSSVGPTFGLQGMNVVIETLVQLTGFTIVTAYALLLAFICGIVTLYLKDKNKSIFLVWMVGFTFAASIFLSSIIPMVPRYLIFLTIFLSLGVAASYKLFYALTKQKAITYMIILIVFAMHAPYLMSYYSTYTKDDWRGFSNSLYGMTQEGDSIVLVPGYMSQPLNYYYSNATDGTMEYFAYNETDLKRIRSLQTKTSYYVVTGDIMSANPNGDALRWLENNSISMHNYYSIYIFKS